MDGLSKAKDETEKKKWAEKARRGLIVDLKKKYWFSTQCRRRGRTLTGQCFH